MKSGNIDQIIDTVFSLYERYGKADYIGEPVSQIEHMSQAAALGKNEGYDEEVILAAFFHDIGHLFVNIADEETMDGFGRMEHERIGADFLLDLGFSERIAKLVQSHVKAKRYLTFKDPEYYEQLSQASKATLVFQGGVMDEEEAHLFEQDEERDLMIKFRNWDELAKEVDIPVNNIDELKLIARRHLENRLI
jgi:phosphonate degradation associated HDIG domain protein